MAARTKRAARDQGALWSLWQLEQVPGQGDIFDVAEMAPATEPGTVSVREAQRYAAYLPDGVRLSEATQGQLRQAVADGQADGRLY